MSAMGPPGGGPAEPRRGTIAPDVAEELPGLSLHWMALQARDGDAPEMLERRLRELSNGYRGATVIAMRTKPVPAAYRTFFRQIGLDPDATRIPSEAAALSRLFHGAFRSQGLVADALLMALIETGVPIWAFDGARINADALGIRAAELGERLGDRPVDPRTLVISDDERIHAILFGEQALTARVSRQTTEVVLVAVAVAGVPRIHVDEAFWLAAEALAMGENSV